VVTSVRVSYRPLYNLPAPLRDPAYATLPGGRFVTLGGLDSADVSSSEIQLADAHAVLHTASLPAAQHDAQAAALGNAVYVFGGGSASELDHILRYDPSRGAVTQVGALSAPQSDVAVAAAGGTAYVVGGYDGTNYLNTIVGWRPGSTPAVQARLPVGLRYAAATVAGNGLIIVGGSSPAGATNSIYRFDLTSHRVTRIGALPRPITHANAAVIGSTVYLVGGRGDAITSQTSDVWAINPVTGHVARAGRLPKPTSDAAVAAIGGSAIIIGGLSGSATLATVGELTPATAG
jgi:N-acetylneuraminic acid mutarotase